MCCVRCVRPPRRVQRMPFMCSSTLIASPAPSVGREGRDVTTTAERPHGHPLARDVDSRLSGVSAGMGSSARSQWNLIFRSGNGHVVLLVVREMKCEAPLPRESYSQRQCGSAVWPTLWED